MSRYVICAMAAMLIGALAAGCAPANRQELVKEVLAVDPDFAKTLEKHQELSNRLETFERELTLKRKTAEEGIVRMRQDVRAAAATVRTKTAEAKRELDPERARLELALSLAGEELRTKRTQRASLGRSIAKLRKSLERDEDVVPSDDRAHRATWMEEMVRDTARLDHELDALAEHVHLLKVKILLIKF